MMQRMGMQGLGLAWALALAGVAVGCGGQTPSAPDSAQAAVPSAPASAAASAAASQAVSSAAPRVVLPPRGTLVPRVETAGEVTARDQAAAAKAAGAKAGVGTAQVGSPCAEGSDCASGVCEGEGCDGGALCAPAQRMCTKDLRAYCGCDGKTFMSSGTCPGRPYARRGDCAGDTAGFRPAARALGSPCREGKDCASGMCEGLGCDGKGAVCVPADRKCTDDLQAYCGCNGVTFHDSGSCPRRPYRARGACAP